MNWYLTVLRKYAVFSGRARRKEYWMFGLFNLIIVMGLALLTELSSSLGILFVIYIFSVIIPNLAVTIRRFHDVGISGWYMLIGVIPFIGAIYMLVITCRDSQIRENQYGPNPKALLNETLKN